jgi:hypothetical protein
MRKNLNQFLLPRQYLIFVFFFIEMDQEVPAENVWYVSPHLLDPPPPPHARLGITVGLKGFTLLKKTTNV